MHAVTLPEASSNLPSLVKEVQAGEEVLILDNQKPVAKLVSMDAISNAPQFGSAKALFEIADNFDEPMECFKDYMP